MCPTREQLEARLKELERERWLKEMSDDFAYTNGSIGRIDAKIATVRSDLIVLGKQQLSDE
ncbi:MAG: hypothetical protein P4M09_17395 [Devosia sp.]|nr:hypothetical protein [Devosia sp.]